MDDKFVNGTMLSDFAKKMKNNIKTDLLGGKKLKYVTQAEYDALTDDEKNDETIIYNITDADIPNYVTQEELNTAIEENGFSGDYNDLENRPCYEDGNGPTLTTFVTDPGTKEIITVNGGMSYGFEPDLPLPADIGNPISLTYTVRKSGTTVKEVNNVTPSLSTPGVYTVSSQSGYPLAFIILEDGLSIGSVSVKKGIYVASQAYGNEYVKSITYTVNNSILKQLDEKFIPDTIARKEYVDKAIEENGFSGDYNDLENKPCYMTPGVVTEIAGPWHPGFINDEDRFEFPEMVDEKGYISKSEEMIRCYNGEVDLSWFEWSVVVMNIPRYGMGNGYVVEDLGERSQYDILNWDDYKLVDNVYTFNKSVFDSSTGEFKYTYICAMIVLQETTLTGTSKSVTYPPGVYITNATDQGGGTGRIEKVGIKPLSTELLPGDYLSLKNDAVLKSRDVMTTLFDSDSDYNDYKNSTATVPSLKTMISAIEYKTANLGPSIVMISQIDYNNLGDNIDPNTLYIIG